jgi:aminopeptidase
VPRGVTGFLPPDDIARYADAAIRVGLHLRKGDDLVVNCQPAHREFAAALVEAAYRTGARTAEVVMTDPLVRAARLRAAPTEKLGELTSWQSARARGAVKETTCTVMIAGESEPGALTGIPPDKVAAEMTSALRKLGDVRRETRRGRRRWGIIAWPVPAWAAQVYPKLSERAAQRRLAHDLLEFCRLGPDDPPGLQGLRDHLSAMRGRARRLTRLRLRGLELRSSGTELSFSFHPDTIWAGGGGKNGFGIAQAPNLPTEECFTSPEASATEGTFCCSRPLMFQGRLIEELAGEFRGGRLVRLEAKRTRDRDWLAGYLASVDGAERLGEVALVDSSSRIGRAGRIYYNTLLDENAAAHIAFGVGFWFTRRQNGNRQSRRGVNHSRAHLDVMIGTDELEATGVGARGRRIPLIRDGAWAI